MLKQLHDGDQPAVKVRANDLSGSEWLRNSISVWSIGKSKVDKANYHQAAFPEALVARLLESFLSGSDRTVLDPFMGSGTTLAVACKQGHRGIGFDVYKHFVDAAKERLSEFQGQYDIHEEDAWCLAELLDEESVDALITSPPYWNIMTRRRTADYKKNREYGNHEHDIGNIESYDQFVESLVEIMAQAHQVLKPGAMCIVNVMDIRVKNKLYALHMDLAREMETIGYELDDIIIWDRRTDYNSLRPLGYPYRFRLNRVHEYVLIFERK